MVRRERSNGLSERSNGPSEEIQRFVGEIQWSVSLAQLARPTSTTGASTTMDCGVPVCVTACDTTTRPPGRRSEQASCQRGRDDVFDEVPGSQVTRQSARVLSAVAEQNWCVPGSHDTRQSGYVSSSTRAAAGLVPELSRPFQSSPKIRTRICPARRPVGERTRRMCKTCMDEGRVSPDMNALLQHMLDCRGIR